jgi:Holliday junction resolvasome RuvABC endonuclease subunit
VGAKRFDWARIHNGKRWWEFSFWLNAFLNVHQTDAIAFEAALYQKGMAAHVANSLVACVERCAWEQGLRCKGYAVSTIKKHATGNGRAEKADMIAAAEARGMKLADHDAVDALWLLDLALHDGELTAE